MNAPVRTLLANLMRNPATLFPGYFPDAKHNHYADFGFPVHLNFGNFYDMYRRNGTARAAVKKTARKTWETHPALRDQPEDGDEESSVEADVRQRFEELRVWQRLAEADRRGLVGSYSGVILRVADNKKMSEPVDSVSGGLEGLVEILPAWESQLKVTRWGDDETSEDYGQPLMFSFTEAEIGQTTGGRSRTVEIHPSRVIIWSETGDVNDSSLLEAGYNDLMTLEKVIGAGGAGFWKNAKSAPVLEIDKEARLSEMAKAMGTDEEGLLEAMNEQVDDWQKGFEKLLMLQGIEAKSLGISLPSPQHFVAAPLQSFAASIEMPVKILVGMQTGERASSEDAEEWASTCMGRRSDWTVPSIMTLVKRLVEFGILPEADWRLQWEDLTEADMSDKIDRAGSMADINAKMGYEVYDADEIRDVTGHGPAPVAEEE